MVLCGNVSATAAQEVSEDTIGGKVHHIDEVTVRARRSFSNMTATAPTLVMDRSLMEQMGMHEVAEAVKHFSGVSVKDYGGIGGLKTISVRSLGAQHTGVCYDGIAISDCQSGQIDISRFSLDNVSLLYFTIGQSDNIYLSAKTFASAGTLSIETMRPDLDQRSYQLNVNLKAGSYGLANPSLMYQQRIHPKVSLSAYTDYLRADGNYPFELRNGTERIEGKRNNSDIETWRAELNAYIDINDRQNINLKAYLFDSERGLPGGVVYDNPYAAERLYDRNYFAQAAYENRFSEHWKLKAGGKFNYTWNRDRNDQASGITDDRYRQTETYLTATLETDNPGNLMPGSFAEIWLYTGKADETISLPYSAITEEQGTYSVFVQVDEDCYKKKNVVLGGNDGERVEILDGLAEGDKVVTDGGIHLKLAASAGVIPGHTHNH